MNLQQGYTTYARVYEMLCRLRRLSYRSVLFERKNVAKNILFRI